MSNMIGAIFLSLLMTSVLTCEQQCKPKSCEDIFKEDHRNPSGDYVIYQRDQAITVYCYKRIRKRFLPIRLVNNKNTQGYRAAGKDFTFRNCDANPNSYLAFYLNPRNALPGNVGYTTPVMTQWISHSTQLQYPDYMDSSFYMDWEMHMGGCGGFTTSKVVSDVKAALGIPFEKEKPSGLETSEEIARICATGIASKPQQFYFASRSRKHFIQCDEFGKGDLMKCRPATLWCQHKLTCGHASDKCEI